MIGVIVVLVVGITISIISTIKIQKNKKRIKEIEHKLDMYYKEREQRLKDKGLID